MKISAIVFSVLMCSIASSSLFAKIANESYLCEQIMETAYNYTCGAVGADDSAECYMKSKSNYYDQDEYDIYWKAVCRRGGEREDICSVAGLPQGTCRRVDCEGMHPEWTYTIGDRDGDPCP